MSFRNRLYYLRVFFLQHKIASIALCFVLFFLVVLPLFHQSQKIPVTQKEFEEALLKGENYFEKQDYQEAFKYLLYPSENGYAKAHFLIAQMYYYGLGRQRDNEKAFEHYEKASRELEEAKYKVASMAFRGETKKLKKSQATTLLMQAAYAGLKSAQNDLGIYSLMSEDYEQAYFWLSLSETQGSYRAKNARQKAQNYLSEYQKGLLDSEIKDFVEHK